MDSDLNKISFDDIHVILFDLDDTLYPHDSGLWALIRERIDQYLLEELHFPAEQVPGLRHRLWKQYGTTLRGLQIEYHVDTPSYLRFVHAVPLQDYLSPDPILERLLASLPQRKYIFTNSDSAHAARVINQLDIAEHFSRIIDVHAMSPHCKPQKEAFLKALEIIAQRPGNCLLIDDSPVNLETAHQLGMATLCVGLRRHEGSEHIERITDLPSIIH